MEAINETLRDLKKRRNTIRLSIIGTALVALVGGLLGFAAHRVTPGAIFLVVALVLYLALVRTLKAAYTRAYALAQVRYGVCGKLQNVTVEEKGEMSREEFLALRMFPLFEGKNSLMCRNAFAGEYAGLPLCGTEVTFHYPYSDEKGNTKYLFASGALLRAKGETSAQNGDWLLLRHGLLADAAVQDLTKTNGYHRVDLNRGELKDQYMLFSRAADGGLMDENLERRLGKMCAASPWISAVRLDGQEAALFMNRRFYAAATVPNTDPTAEGLRNNTMPERDDIVALFRTWFGARQLAPPPQVRLPGV